MKDTLVDVLPFTLGQRDRKNRLKIAEIPRRIARKIEVALPRLTIEEPEKIEAPVEVPRERITRPAQSWD